jgi:DNA-binding NtrC family response regulator
VISDTNHINAYNLELSDNRIKQNTPVSLKEHKYGAEKQAIKSAILFSGGQADIAANQLKISRSSLYRLMDKHGLQLV